MKDADVEGDAEDDDVLGLKDLQQGECVGVGEDIDRALADDEVERPALDHGPELIFGNGTVGDFMDGPITEDADPLSAGTAGDTVLGIRFFEVRLGGDLPVGPGVPVGGGEEGKIVLKDEPAD